MTEFRDGRAGPLLPSASLSIVEEFPGNTMRTRSNLSESRLPRYIVGAVAIAFCPRGAEFVSRAGRERNFARLHRVLARVEVRETLSAVCRVSLPFIVSADRKQERLRDRRRETADSVRRT